MHLPRNTPPKKKEILVRIGLLDFHKGGEVVLRRVSKYSFTTSGAFRSHPLAVPDRLNVLSPPNPLRTNAPKNERGYGAGSEGVGRDVPEVQNKALLKPHEE
jgi:hypothetical protein